MNTLRLRYTFAVLLGLAACGNTPSDLPTIPDLLAGLTAPEQPAVTADVLRASLTPEILARSESRLLLLEVPSRDAVAILSRVEINQGVETYLTADGLAISLRDGIVVATRGFGFDLMVADTGEMGDALPAGAASSARVHRYLDGENHIIAQSFGCRVSRTSERTMRESCASSEISFENSYSLNEAGVIVASRQWVSPQIGYFVIEMLN
ncbi:MAG: YjbF family lipoprotein [Yoonia sp.]